MHDTFHMVAVYSDRRIKVEEIANALHISHGSILTTLHDRLGMQANSPLGPKIPWWWANGSQSISIQRIVEAV